MPQGVRTRKCILCPVVDFGFNLTPVQNSHVARICLTFRAVHVRPAVQLVAKSVNSAFIGTDLDLRLRCLRANAVVVFGMRTDMCVSSTARSGANLGWSVNVVRDACDCCYLHALDGGLIPAEDAHRVHLATLADEFAQVVATKMIITCMEATGALDSGSSF